MADPAVRPGLTLKTIRSRASCLRSSGGRRKPAPISILIKQWIGSPCSFICGVLIGFALYSKKACSLINPFDAGAVIVIRSTSDFVPRDDQEFACEPGLPIVARCPEKGGYGIALILLYPAKLALKFLLSLILINHRLELPRANMNYKDTVAQATIALYSAAFIKYGGQIFRD